MIETLKFVLLTNVVTIISMGIDILQKWLYQPQDIDTVTIVDDKILDINEHVTEYADRQVLGDDPFNIIFHNIDLND